MTCSPSTGRRPRSGTSTTWPRSLESVVRLVLTSRFSMWMAWGPELTFFCNEAYRRDTLGEKYPWALGKPASVVWSEIWDDIGPRIDTVMTTGQATWDESLMLFLERSGYTEETFHTFSYSPIFDDHGVIAGMLCVVKEDTEEVVAHRRMQTLRDLGSRRTSNLTEAETISTACDELADEPGGPAVLAGLPLRRGRRHGPAGRQRRLRRPAPGRARRPAGGGPGRGLAGGPCRRRRAGDRRPASRSGSSTCRAAPGTSARRRPSWCRSPPAPAAAPYGFQVFGLNRFRPLDDGYRDFCDLIAGQLAASLTDARAYEFERGRAETLAELDQAKTDFFTNVSHEFRTPLTLLLGPAEDALSDDAEPLAGRQRDRVEVILRNGQRLLKLVNTLLDFSRLESGRVEARFEPVDLAQLHPRAGQHVRDRRRTAGAVADPRLRSRCRSPCTSTATCGPRSSSTCCPTP